MYGKKRYFYANEYNAVRMVNRLAELVEEAGGTAERHSEELSIYTRGYDERIGRLEDMVRATEHFYSGDPDKRDAVLAKQKKELEDLRKERENAPVVKTRFVSLICDLWLRFTLDGFRYSFSTEGNPFFPDRWSKVPVGSDGQYYLDEIECSDKFYYPDDMFHPVAKEETIEKAAKDLLDFFVKQKASERYA